MTRKASAFAADTINLCLIECSRQLEVMIHGRWLLTVFINDS